MVILRSRRGSDELRSCRVRFEQKDVKCGSLQDELLLGYLLLLPEAGVLRRQGLLHVPVTGLNVRLYRSDPLVTLLRCLCLELERGGTGAGKELDCE